METRTNVFNVCEIRRLRWVCYADVLSESPLDDAIGPGHQSDLDTVIAHLRARRVLCASEDFFHHGPQQNEVDWNATRGVTQKQTRSVLWVFWINGAETTITDAVASMAETETGVWPPVSTPVKSSFQAPVCRSEISPRVRQMLERALWLQLEPVLSRVGLQSRRTSLLVENRSRIRREPTDRNISVLDELSDQDPDSLVAKGVLRSKAHEIDSRDEIVGHLRFSMFDEHILAFLDVLDWRISMLAKHQEKAYGELQKLLWDLLQPLRSNVELQDPIATDERPSKPAENSLRGKDVTPVNAQPTTAPPPELLAKSEFSVVISTEEAPEAKAYCPPCLPEENGRSEIESTQLANGVQEGGGVGADDEANWALVSLQNIVEDSWRKTEMEEQARATPPISLALCARAFRVEKENVRSLFDLRSPMQRRKRARCYQETRRLAKRSAFGAEYTPLAPRRLLDRGPAGEERSSRHEEKERTPLGKRQPQDERECDRAGNEGRFVMDPAGAVQKGKQAPPRWNLETFSRSSLQAAVRVWCQDCLSPWTLADLSPSNRLLEDEFDADTGFAKDPLRLRCSSVVAEAAAAQHTAVSDRLASPIASLRCGLRAEEDATGATGGHNGSTATGAGPLSLCQWGSLSGNSRCKIQKGHKEEEGASCATRLLSIPRLIVSLKDFHMAVPPAVLPTWEAAQLLPCSEEKWLEYAVMCPAVQNQKAVESAVNVLMRNVHSVFHAMGLGEHQPLNLTPAKESPNLESRTKAEAGALFFAQARPPGSQANHDDAGLSAFVHPTVEKTAEEVGKVCRMLRPVLEDRASAATPRAEGEAARSLTALVVYVVSLVPEADHTVEGQALVEAAVVEALMGGEKPPSGDPEPRLGATTCPLVIQTLTLDQLWPDKNMDVVVRSLCTSIYNKARVLRPAHPVSHAAAGAATEAPSEGEGAHSVSVFEPLVTLASPLEASSAISGTYAEASSVRESDQEKEDGGEQSTERLKGSSRRCWPKGVLHGCYECVGEDPNQWLVSAWTDDVGEIRFTYVEPLGSEAPADKASADKDLNGSVVKQYGGDAGALSPSQAAEIMGLISNQCARLLCGLGGEVSALIVGKLGEVQRAEKAWWALNWKDELFRRLQAMGLQRTPDEKWPFTSFLASLQPLARVSVPCLPGTMMNNRALGILPGPQSMSKLESALYDDTFPRRVEGTELTAGSRGTGMVVFEHGARATIFNLPDSSVPSRRVGLGANEISGTRWPSVRTEVLQVTLVGWQGTATRSEELVHPAPVKENARLALKNETSLAGLYLSAIVEEYHRLSWLTVDPNTAKRTSCMPLHAFCCQSVIGKLERWLNVTRQARTTTSSET